MTPTRILIGAVAASALFAGAAVAQAPGPMSPSQQAAQEAAQNNTTWTGPLINNPSSSSSMDSPSASASSSMDAGASVATPAPSASAMGADASVTASPPAPMGAPSLTITTVTNGPVPDTAENRAKYGQPMSRAGRMTRPAGN